MNLGYRKFKFGLSCCYAVLLIAGAAMQLNAETSNKATTTAMITLEDALARLAQAKRQLFEERALLAKHRGRMSQDSVEVWRLRLDRRGRRIEELEKSYNNKAFQFAKENEIREKTGAEFYRSQSEYYRLMLSSDLDLSLD